MKLKEKEEYFGWRPMEYNSMKCSNKENNFSQLNFLNLEKDTVQSGDL